MPSRLSSRFRASAARRSLCESTLPWRMNSVTSQPAERHIDANSSATAPEPMIAALCGNVLSSSACVESMTAALNGVPGRGRGEEPVAITTSAAWISKCSSTSSKPPSSAYRRTCALPSDGSTCTVRRVAVRRFDMHGAVPVERRLALVHGDAPERDQAAQSLRHRVHGVFAVVAQLAKVDLLQRGHDAHLRAVAHRVQCAGGGDERLRGDAAAVEACAAERGVTLDHDDALAQLRRPQCGGVPAGTCADDCDIELLCHRAPLWDRPGPEKRPAAPDCSRTLWDRPGPEKRPAAPDCSRNAGFKKGRPNRTRSDRPEANGCTGFTSASARASCSAAWEDASGAAGLRGSTHRNRCACLWPRTVRRTWRSGAS